MSEPGAFNIKLAKRTLLIAVAAIGFAQTVLFAVLAPLGRETGLLDVQIGAIISSSSLTLFLVSPFWGRASDRWGRRRVLLIGLFGYTLGMLLFVGVFQIALLGYLIPVSAFIALTVARVCNATVMAAVTPSANAYMADITSVADRTKAMGAIGAATSIGSILGPAIGGLLASITLLTPLYFSAFITLAAAILALFVLPERKPPQTSTKNIQRLKYTDPRILPYVTAGVLLFMGFAVVQQTVAFRFQDALGLSNTETAQMVGTSFMLAAVASLFVQLVVIRRVTMKPFDLLRISIPLIMLSFAMMGLGGSQLVFTLAMMIQGFGMGLALPGFMAGASLAVSAEEQGAVAGVASSCPPLGFAIGPLLGTYLYSHNPVLPYYFSCAVFFFLFLFTLRAGRKI